jgi:nitroimidazol reductase NimA-like FMN-containing flavoprotein (pyridoxamine 5'-phosphate oxidase superfamily)
MEVAVEQKILKLLSQHRLMTVATLRADGWPHATTVAFVNEGLTLYFLCEPQSQKALNLAADQRISLTIDHDDAKPASGLSMAARAQVVTDPSEISRARRLLAARSPEYIGEVETLLVFRVTPEFISLIDYSQGFGHTDLVAV